MMHNHVFRHNSQNGDVVSMYGIFVFSILLNMFFVLIEAVVGVYSGSLGLLSDAGHNLSDVFSLSLALVGLRLASLPASHRFTYGYKKSTVLIPLLNAIILLVVVGVILFKAFGRLYEPSPVDGSAVTWTAVVGIVINGFTALLLLRGGQEDINIRGAFLHMAADALVSLGVVVSGVAISLTGYYIIDPLISIALSCVIIYSAWRLLAESLSLSLDGTPAGVSYENIMDILLSDGRVAGVHHIHIWAISTTEVALTAHVVLSDLSQFEIVKPILKERLRAVGVVHSTLEPELLGSCCPERGE